MREFMKWLRRVAPGLLLAVTIALAARFVTSQYGGPVMLLTLLLGVAFNFLANETRCAPGINFASRDVLKVGVALLGAALTFADANALGLEALAIIAVAVIGTLAGGILLARLAGLDLAHAILSAGSVAICGASAAMAIASVLPRTREKERRTVIVVAGVTILSTLAMILYPSLAMAIGMSDARAGLFIGASIHDVAQVVAGGHVISDEAGANSAVVKLVRVMFLAPMIFLTALMFRATAEREGERQPVVPLFVIGFFAVMAANSLGYVPPAAATAMTELSRWCLVIAVAALGMKMSVTDVLGTSARPFAVLTAQTLLMLGLVLAAMALIPGAATSLLR
ncbi:MAG: putative sulfate exporter family transporter [Pseudomonadota bacterium]|nr:putative sulfate exporter family transporter [Pseudomonadota bacterium]